jgi:integral membrane protein (TIGR00529 family)
VLIPAWISFLLVIGFILLLSKQELSIVLAIAAVIFALLAEVNLISAFLNVFLDLSIIVLAIAVTLIPILGGLMEKSGLMLELVKKLKVSKKTSLMVTPAFFGMLPVAGGALMSAPIIDQIDPDLDSYLKVGINVWYRHVLILIYPLSSALIVASVLSGISLYVLVGALLIPFCVLIIVGYYFMVRKVKPKDEQNERDLKRVLHNFIPLIIAPLFDFIGRSLFPIDVPELYLLIGLIISVFVALGMARMDFSHVKEIAKEMKLWRFPLLILAMFLFLEVFTNSGVPDTIGALNLPFILFICIAFFFGYATGRIQLPLSILIPIFLIQYSMSIMPLIEFIFLYCAIFLGYLITPIHPCVSYSINYLETDYKNTLKGLAKPTFFCFILLLIFYPLFSLVV